jgi:hypothetical protein
MADDPFQAPLATIASDAIDLVSGPLRTQTKACEQPDCPMLLLISLAVPVAGGT